MGIQETSRDVDSHHMQLVNLARAVVDGQTTYQEALQAVDGMTQNMNHESAQAIKDLFDRLTRGK